MKRMLAITLSLLLLCSALGSVALAEEARDKITVSIYDRGRVPASEGTIENNRWTEWINENGPVDVEFVAIPRTNPQEKLYVLFASGTAPDIVFEFNPTIRNTLFHQEQLLPMADVIDAYSTNYKALMEEYPALASAGLMPDGELYTLGKINVSNITRCVLIRQDWLNNLGLSMPTTVEELREVCRAFGQDDPDGNGENDTFAMAMSYRAEETFDEMFYADTVMEGDGEMKYGWDEIATRTEFKKWLYDNGLIDREYMSDTNGAKAMQDFFNGKTGILPCLNGLDLNFALNEYTTFKANNPDGVLAPMPYPTHENGITYMPTLLNPVQMTAFVNANTKNPEAVMKYLDFACSEEFVTAMKYGFEGEHFEFVDGHPTIIDADKFANEVSWASDWLMLQSVSTLAKYSSDTDNFDLSDPIQAEAYELRKAALALYMDPSLIYAGLTHSEHMPQLPEELTAINANIELGEFYARAVVGGTSYTVEQAIADAQAAWTKGGGDQIFEWWQNWYENERDSAFLGDELVQMVIDGNPLNYLK